MIDKESLKQFYFLGRAVDTEIGKLNFIRLKDYPEYAIHLNAIKMSKKEILRHYKKHNINGELDQLIFDLNRSSLFNIVNNILPDFSDSYHAILTKIVENQESLTKINAENFNKIRLIIMDMHCLSEEEISENEEIQEFNDISKMLKSDSQSELKDIVSCVAAFNGYDYEYIGNMTIYQLYLSYYRMAEIMNYNTSILFATVSPTTKLGDWSKYVDIYKTEDHHLSNEESNSLQKMFGSQ